MVKGDKMKDEGLAAAEPQHTEKGATSKPPLTEKGVLAMPIDLVIPMVFAQDPHWQSDYVRYHVGGSVRAMKHVRWRSWGTEELLVRCCLKYMPWLRCIHILLASETQVQDWMKEMVAAAQQQTGRPSINLVFHREFIPEKYLPCFTSPCIEMFSDGP